MRTVLIVVAIAIALYLIYVLRQPIRWIFIAGFLAIALSGPVNLLGRYMKRGFAIAVVYVILLTLPFLLAALFLPPIVGQANSLADNLPTYAAELTEFVESNGTLASAEENFDIAGQIQEAAQSAPSRLSDAASILSDLGIAVVNSLFAVLTILVLCAFMLGSGRGWIERLLALQPEGRAQRLDRVIDRVGHAVGNYVAGAAAIAVIAGTLGFVVLVILGVPFAGPLAVLVGLFSLIPLVGATIAAVIVGVVTLFNDFPTATIVWTVYAIVYQQVENHVIQPQIQRRAVQLHPFVVLVAVLFGSTLFGVLGALIAIPAAASIQIAVREFWSFRVRERNQAEGVGEAPILEPPAATAAAPEPAG